MSCDNNIPSSKTLMNSVKIAIKEDKAIMLDYYMDSISGKCIIGKNTDTDEMMLVKSEEEYTSPISKIYKVEKEYIVTTENSIYIISSSIVTKKIS